MAAPKETMTAGLSEVDPERAWAPYEPDRSRPWDLRLSGHLLRRATFGAGWPELQRALAEGPRCTVERLLDPEADMASFNNRYDRYEAAVSRGGSAEGLRSWWLRRMIETPHPFLEKMTLFWHGCFATSNDDVKNAGLMRRHMALLRSQALGNFATLLEEISHDPAMLIGVGGELNCRSSPNPHFVRHLVEDFGPGSGNFHERDVREAARAYTGWLVQRGRLRYVEREHDNGRKTILGQTGNWDSRDVVRIVLEQPATASFVVRRLFRWLISETEEPSEALIAPLAESFRDGYDVKKLVGTMLRSNLFFSPVAYRQRVKGPVEFALGIVRALEGMVPTARLGADLTSLGQNLYHPSTVKGWPGGRLWINDWTSVQRGNLAWHLVAGSGPYADKLDPLSITRKYHQSGKESAAHFLLDLFVQGDVPRPVVDALDKTAGGSGEIDVRRLAWSIVTLPEFQLA